MPGIRTGLRLNCVKVQAGAEIQQYCYDDNIFSTALNQSELTFYWQIIDIARMCLSS